MKKIDYYKLLKHPEWQKKRLEVMARAGWKCENCEENSETLNVHHAYYIAGRKPWEYPDWCFSSLCEECHKNSHDHTDDEDDPWTDWETLIGELMHGGYHPVLLDLASLLNDCRKMVPEADGADVATAAYFVLDENMSALTHHAMRCMENKKSIGSGES